MNKFQDLESKFTAVQSPHNTSSSSGSTLNQLITHLKKIQLNPPSQSAQSTDDLDIKLDGSLAEMISSNPALVYDIYYHPEVNGPTSHANLCDMEARLSLLERTLGHIQDSDATPRFQEPLVALISKLERHIELLIDPKQLDRLHRQVKSFNQEMTTTLSTQKMLSALVDPVMTKKVDQMYSVMEQADTLFPNLSHVLDRLQTLQNIHREASQFSTALHNISAETNQMEVKLKDLDCLMSGFEETIQKNSETMQQNMASLQQRIQVLFHRIQTLEQ
jgi:hypothetical protein